MACTGHRGQLHRTWQIPPLPPLAGYLAVWLTATALQEHPNASSKLLYDVRARSWSEILVEASGIEPRLLAPIIPAH